MTEDAKPELNLTLSTSELGKTIVQAAQDERRKRFTAKIVAIADSEMESISVNEKKLEYYKTLVDLSKQRLAAIEAGEFTISDRGAFQFKNEGLRMPNEDTPIDDLISKFQMATARSK